MEVGSFYRSVRCDNEHLPDNGIDNFDFNDSDLDLDPVEGDIDSDLEYQPCDDSSSSESSDSTEPECTARPRKLSKKCYSWNKRTNFSPSQRPEKLLNEQRQSQDDSHKLFECYFSNDVITKLVNSTNSDHLAKTGLELGVTVGEMKQFLGMSILMGTLRYPTIKMYFSSNLKPPCMRNAMPRRRFFKIRNHLHVTQAGDENESDKLWKIRPLVDQVRSVCQSIPRDNSEDLSIDEQMIPFTGKCNIRQYVRGKPYPTGLKLFVLSNNKGKILDFNFYCGKGTFPDDQREKVGNGGCAVLNLTSTLKEGTQLFMDRFFTSFELADYLLKKKLFLTGTIMNRKVSKLRLKSDKDLKKEGRGSYDFMVRNDGKQMVVKLYDNRSTCLITTQEKIQPLKDAKRYDKLQKKYVNISLPGPVAQYNAYMGGVDLSNRMISMYRCSLYKTKKWPVRCILHLVDMALLNCWLERNKTTKLQFHDFRLHLSTILMNANSMDDSPSQEIRPPIECRKTCHIPMFDYKTFSSRCKNQGCNNRTKVECNFCKVHLCLTSQRNCFAAFHS